MVDRLRVCLFWLFVTGIIASLWLFAKARNVIVGAPHALPPPRYPTTQPAPRPLWPHAASEEGALGATDMTDDEYYAE